MENTTLYDIKEKFSNLPKSIKFVVKGEHGKESIKQLTDFLKEYTKLNKGISLKVENTPTEQNSPVVELWVDGDPTGISYCGIPRDRELEAFHNTLLNIIGIGENMPDQIISSKIKQLIGPGFIFTFVSKDCPGCPDVSEAMNHIALLNHQFKNMTVDIDAAPDFASAYGVKSVPAVFVNGDLLSLGHASLGQLVMDMEKRFGSSLSTPLDDHSALGFDAIVAGGGPAGVSAAVYLARKGFRTAVVAGMVGGQVADTVVIENLISEKRTTGSDLADALREDLKEYGITLFENRKIIESSLHEKNKRIKSDRGEWFEAPALIIATGASWRKLGIPGEEKYIGQGVAFCTHCDGPFYKGKNVAVVGGGNSGVEAAIDLARICKHIDLFEYTESLKADEILCQRLKALDNVTIHLNSQLTEILGNEEKGVTSLKVMDRATGAARDIRLDGVFIQAGLTPNSTPFQGELIVNDKGEIVTDKECRTDIKGVYAAGDVTNGAYKQIVIAMGEGAKAALSAVSDLIRGEEKL